MSDRVSNQSSSEAWGHYHSATSRAEPLLDHLHGVSDLASAFAEELRIGVAEWARVAGHWHDLGKYSDAFQMYIRSGTGESASCESARGRIDHSTAGAQHADQTLGLPGRLLAFAIAGHHAGLPDWIDEAGGERSLEKRLQKGVEPWREGAPVNLTAAPAEPLADPAIAFAGQRNADGFRIALLTRMLFSCLVDADYLATERFFRPDKTGRRERGGPPLKALSDALERWLTGFKSDSSTVNAARRRVQDACRRAAKEPPGLFSLTSPTGSGKTLSSLLFALRHAIRHDMRRVIYAIPFTSIIEQNAKVFREALASAGAGAVLEHHSAVEPEESADDPWTKLAAENYDAPLVVTTNVQLLESLFASRPGRCRKLHRIARSVIIFDEAQALPVDLLKPTLALLDELRRNYGCTIVLCTATQPALTRREGFPIGLEGVHEINGDEAEVAALFADLERVTVEQAGRLDDDAVIERLMGETQALCVVNTRGHAADIWRGLDEREPGAALHLSAQMCPAHRTDVIDGVKTRLKDAEPCRVVSTQLIEAGVDLDFPVVYRAMAGLDSLAQAAGRCNREGAPELGRFVIFETDRTPTLAVKQAAESAREALADGAEPFALGTIERFFEHHFWKKGDEWDKHCVMECFDAGAEPYLQFRQAAERYRLIRNEQVGVVVPYGDKGKATVDRLMTAGDEPLDRKTWRGLQRFTVGVYEHSLRGLLDTGVVVPALDGRLLILNDPDAYDEHLGLRLDALPSPERMVVDPSYASRLSLEKQS